MPLEKSTSFFPYGWPHTSQNLFQWMRWRYYNKSPVSPSKTALAMLHTSCSGNFIWVILDGLSWWLEILTAYNISYWLIEQVCAALPHVFYAVLQLHLVWPGCDMSTVVLVVSCFQWLMGTKQPELVPVIEYSATLEDEYSPLELLSPSATLEMLQQWLCNQLPWLLLLPLWKMSALVALRL